MKKLLTKTTFLLILSLTGISFPKTYFVNFTLGSDCNSGRSSATAWKTANKVSGYNLSPGDSVLFKRGEPRMEKYYIHVSTTAIEPIYFSAQSRIGTKIL